MKFAKMQMQSRFICLKCGKYNGCIEGINRHRLREKNHIKDAYCINCGVITKNVEIRTNDSEAEIRKEAEELTAKYYGGDENI